MTIINLCPHAISVVNAAGDVVATFEPSGTQARVAVSSETVAVASGVPVKRTVFGAVSGLPAPQDGVIYLTSTLVAQAARRSDVVSPDTGPTAVRENGQVIGVRSFQTF